MDLKVGKLKEIVASTIGQDLIAENFTIDKSLTWLKKTINKKNKIRVFIDYYNYAPVKLEFRLIFQFWILEIVQEMQAYHQYLNESFSKDWPTLSFSEGDFNSTTKHLEHKFRNAYTHVVTKINSTNLPIQECRKTLNEEIIPILSTFSILEEFQDYVLNNYKDIGESTLTKPSIIAMKLMGAKELKMIVEHFWSTLQLDQKPKDHVFRRYIENIIPYSENH